MGVLEEVRLWWQVRSAIKIVERENDLGPVMELLREHPGAAERVTNSALQLAEQALSWPAMLLAFGLIRNGQPAATKIVRRLAKRDFVCWERLDGCQLKELRTYLFERREIELLVKANQWLSPEQKRGLALEVDQTGYLDFFEQLSRTDLIDSAVADIVAFLEQVEPISRSESLGIENAIEAAKILWDWEEYEHSMRLWAMIAKVAPVTFDDHQLLQSVAETLPQWVPVVKQVALEGLPENYRQDLMTHPPLPRTPPALVRAAQLLHDFPNPAWIKPLQTTWILLDDLTRRDFHGEQQEKDPVLLMAAFAVTAALGSNAAASGDLQISRSDPKGHRQRVDALNEKIEERNRSVEAHNRLVESKTREQLAINEIKALRWKIEELDQDIAAQHHALRSEMSPAELLRQILNDAQSYPVDVRQGAAWGLKCILEDDALGSEDRNQIQKSLRAAVHPIELNAAEARELIAGSITVTEERLRELLAVAEEYARDQNPERLRDALLQLAPESETLAPRLQALIDKSRRPRGHNDFHERAVRILPDSSLMEFSGALQRGLEWMEKIVAAEKEKDLDLETNLAWIATLVYQLMPNVLAFIANYPLRLMTLDRHRHILGVYSSEKLNLTFWTRFQPPAWFHGAKPGDFGPVKKRYLTLEDRSVPNSMGIFYRLLKHPVLALPVIYHEFLHYGGLGGEPETGIRNETETLLREILFARGLIAELAPAEKNKFDQYEKEIIEAVSRSEMAGLVHQLFLEFEDDGVLAGLNDEIARIYGEQLDQANAKIETEKKIEKKKAHIFMENNTSPEKLSWNPEIDWPELDTEATRLLSARYRQGLCAGFQQNHRITPDERDRISAERVSVENRNEWAAFLQRHPSFLHALKKISDPSEVQSLIYRFILNAPADSRPQLIHLVYKMINSTKPGQ